MTLMSRTHSFAGIRESFSACVSVFILKRQMISSCYVTTNNSDNLKHSVVLHEKKRKSTSMHLAAGMLYKKKKDFYLK